MTILLLIRLSLATIFIWFGLLKVTGNTAAFDLVADTIYWFPVAPKSLIPLLGMAEIALGFGMLLGRGLLLRLTLLLFLLHMAGTFLVLALQPDVAFQRGNPLLLTTEGEYVIKNLVLVAAGLTLFAITLGEEKRI